MIALLVACNLPKIDSFDSGSDTGSGGGYVPPTCVDEEALDGPLSADCGEPAPDCGGDPTGSWIASTECGPSFGGPASGFTVTYPSSYYYGCPGETLQHRSTFDDELLLGADGSFTADSVETVTQILGIPPSCTYGYPCAEIAYEVGGECGERPDGGCDCTNDVEFDVHLAGSWSTCGATLALASTESTFGYTESGETGSTELGVSTSYLEYCADGGVLRVREPVSGGSTGYVPE